MTLAGAATRAFINGQFLAKLIAVIVMIPLADWLFFRQPAGWTLGGFGLLVLAALWISRPALRTGLHACVLSVGTALYAGLLLANPSGLGFALLWFALVSLTLLPRRSQEVDAWVRLKAVLAYSLIGWIAAIRDFFVVRKIRLRRRSTLKFTSIIQTLILPIMLTSLFIWLFAAANPLVEQFLNKWSFSGWITSLSLVRLLFWNGVALILWSLLRPKMSPRRVRISSRNGLFSQLADYLFTSASIRMSLIFFNLLFAAYNGLDVAFLWSGQTLPDGLTFASYAHRGAYPLIATALLAAWFVLVAVRPGTPSTSAKITHGLIYLWVGQNVFLVASSILRTLDYIDVYALTLLRLSALIWMALVALGLIFICISIAKNTSRRWLINANAIAVVLVLTVCNIMDLRSVVANHNVTLALSAGTKPAKLDICYLFDLGPSALPALMRYEKNIIQMNTADKATVAVFAMHRSQSLSQMQDKQQNWRTWTPRGAALLRQALSLNQAMPAPPKTIFQYRACA